MNRAQHKFNLRLREAEAKRQAQQTKPDFDPELLKRLAAQMQTKAEKGA